MPYCINLNDFDSTRQRIVGGPWPDQCVDCGSSSSTSAQSSSSSDGCPRTLDVLTACKIVDGSGSVVGFEITWRVSDDSYQDQNGRYQYFLRYCTPVCWDLYELSGGVPVALSPFNSPDPNPDGSFTKRIVLSPEIRAWSGNFGETTIQTYLDQALTLELLGLVNPDPCAAVVVEGIPLGADCALSSSSTSAHSSTQSSSARSSSSLAQNSSSSTSANCLISNVTACVDSYDSPGLASGTVSWTPISNTCSQYIGYEIEVFYQLGDGSGVWSGYSVASPLTASSAPVSVFSNTGTQRYRVRAVNQLLEPTVYTDWVESNTITYSGGPFCSSSSSGAQSSSSATITCETCANNLLANGDFQGNGGWTFSNVDVVGYDSDDNVWVDLSACSPGYISQTITTTPGQVYTLSFLLSGNCGCRPDWPCGARQDNVYNTKVCRASAGSTSEEFSFSCEGLFPNNSAEMGWVRRAMTFVADSSQTLIKFEALEPATTCFGAAIDCVCVTLGGSSSSGSCRVVSVFADATLSYNGNTPKYLNTGVYFEAGDPINATASGLVAWNGGSEPVSDPDGLVLLKGMVLDSTDTYAPGNGAEFTMRSVFSGTAPVTGYLFVAIFDSLYTDNSGGYDVVIQACRQPSSSSSVARSSSSTSYRYYCVRDRSSSSSSAPISSSSSTMYLCVREKSSSSSSGFSSSSSAARVVCDNCDNNLVTNGGFEDTPAFIGWTNSNAAITQINDDPRKWLDLYACPGGYVSQTITTVAGATYTLSFLLAPSSCPSNAPGTPLCRVTVGNDASDFIAECSESFGPALESRGWQRKTVAFVATGATTFIKFETIAQSPVCEGVSIDCVCVTAGSSSSSAAPSSSSSFVCQGLEYSVDPRVAWQDTGIDITGSVRITARGVVSDGTLIGADGNIYPDGDLSGPDGNIYWPPGTGASPYLAYYHEALLGKVNDEVFLVGSSYEGSPGAGRLYLMTNDDIRDDNSGAYLACIEVGSSSSNSNSSRNNSSSARSSASGPCYETPTQCTGGELTINVTNPVFTNSGVYLEAGESFSVRARGCGTCYTPIPGSCDAGPDGNGAPYYFLRVVGTVNSSPSATLNVNNTTWFPMGSSYDGFADASGYLYVGVYDWVYSDNQGNFCVTVTKTSSSRSSSSRAQSSSSTTPSSSSARTSSSSSCLFVAPTSLTAVCDVFGGDIELNGYVYVNLSWSVEPGPLNCTVAYEVQMLGNTEGIAEEYVDRKFVSAPFGPYGDDQSTFFDITNNNRGPFSFRIRPIAAASYQFDLVDELGRPIPAGEWVYFGGEFTRESCLGSSSSSAKRYYCVNDKSSSSSDAPSSSTVSSSSTMYYCVNMRSSSSSAEPSSSAVSSAVSSSSTMYYCIEDVSSSSGVARSSSSSGDGGGDPVEYTCANGCEASIAMVYPPVAPGHYATQQACRDSGCPDYVIDWYGACTPNGFRVCESRYDPVRYAAEGSYWTTIENCQNQYPTELYLDCNWDFCYFCGSMGYVQPGTCTAAGGWYSEDEARNYHCPTPCYFCPVGSAPSSTAGEYGCYDAGGHISESERDYACQE